MVSEILSRLLNAKPKLFSTSSTTLWYIAAIMVVAIVSLGMYFVFPPTKEAYLFYFPQAEQVRAEVHYIPVSRGDREKLIETYIQELLLGPINIELEVLLSRNTKVRTVMLRKNTVYVNIDASVFMLHDTLHTSLSQAISLFKSNILRNFQFVNTVIVFIDGEEVL